MSERMFLAVALDNETRHTIVAHLDNEMGERKLPGKLVHPENWHITLRFLGDTSTMQADAIRAHLDQHLMVERFRLRLSGLGGFPRERKASVLWMGLAGDLEPLNTLADECETAAVRAGLEPEGRPFHPHITLSRIRPPQDVRSLIDEMPGAGIRLDVDAVTLYRTKLGNGPVRYEIVDQIVL
ncbi:MAG: RNA 2',3'-cyclic phosphodiesterase [bacterium]|nr:RNA 2',3'-cyclic phosphodiesterase [bacterium]